MLSGRPKGEQTCDKHEDAFDLCVTCKGCKRDCPTGVDMTKMKVEFFHHYKARHGYTLIDKLIASLPDYAHLASRLAPLLNLRDKLPGLAALSEKIVGFSARCTLPQSQRNTFWQPLANATAQTVDGKVSTNRLKTATIEMR